MAAISIVTAAQLNTSGPPSPFSWKLKNEMKKPGSISNIKRNLSPAYSSVGQQVLRQRMCPGEFGGSVKHERDWERRTAISSLSVKQV